MLAKAVFGREYRASIAPTPLGPFVQSMKTLTILATGCLLPLAMTVTGHFSAQLLEAGTTVEATARGAAEGEVITVTGNVAPSALGRVLMHEHLFMNFDTPPGSPDNWAAVGRTRPVGATAVQLYQSKLSAGILADVMLGAPNRDNWLLNDEDVAIAELSEFAKRGGGTLVELTGSERHGNPEALERVSRATGVRIVMGTGWYTSGWHGTDFDKRSVESLTEELVKAVNVGVGTSGIRAGIIGEIGTGTSDGGSTEEKVVRAAARASRLTGAALSLHSPANATALKAVLSLIASENADLNRVIAGHADLLAARPDVLGEIASQGVNIEFDMLGEPPLVTRSRPIDSVIASTIVKLIAAGYTDQILLSQDVNEKTRLKAWGGTGYSFIEETFIPYLKRQGVTDEQIRKIVEVNPQRLLSMAAPGHEGTEP